MENSRQKPEKGFIPIHHNVFSTTISLVDGITNRLIGSLRRYHGAPMTIAQYPTTQTDKSKFVLGILSSKARRKILFAISLLRYHHGIPRNRTLSSRYWRRGVTTHGYLAIQPNMLVRRLSSIGGVCLHHSRQCLLIHR